MVRVFDKFGREFYITKEVWRKQVLPRNLRDHWKDAEQLHTLIASALADGFFPDVLKAAEQLYRIDQNRSRGACVYAVTLLANQQINSAEAILNSYLGEHGNDGYVLTNLAKVHAARNEKEKADATLWHALEVDPNQENALGWYAALAKDRDGAAAQVDAWRRVAGLPGSWRAQVWLARAALESRDMDQALFLYRESIARAGEQIPADLLMCISGDLGNHGRLRDALVLCEPLFRPALHGLAVGNNLIKANLDLRRVERATEIVNALYALKRPDWNENLQQWENRIAEARAAKATADIGEDLEVTIVATECPIWLSAETTPKLLRAPKPEDAPVVCLLGSTAELAVTPNEITHQLPQAPGRMSRALPLYLGEQISLTTTARSLSLVPFVPNGSFILKSEAWTDEEAVAYAKMSVASTEFLITVHLVAQTEPWDVRVRLIRVPEQKCVGECTIPFSPDKPEASVSKLVRQLMDVLTGVGVERERIPAWCDAPVGVDLAPYLLRLEQLLTVQVSGLAREKFLSGEREILSGQLILCLNSPQSVALRLLLLETALAMKKVRPDVVREFVDRIRMLQWDHLLDEPAQTVTKELVGELIGD